jgi:hypothetical protein
MGGCDAILCIVEVCSRIPHRRKRAMANRVVHFDVYADDVERAMAVYQNVFGWTIQKVEWMD